MNRWGWPLAAAAALAAFVGIARVVEAEPAFESADLAVDTLPAEGLGGAALPALDRPTFVLLWLPG